MNAPTKPLAERVRPQKLDEIIGQDHLLGPEAMLRQAIELGTIPSMIFWGPPGVGKTTLANLIAQQLHRPFYLLSAISSGVQEVRKVIQEAKIHGNAILFIDEIHRFNKGQQDALLGAVEKGIVTLIGATTENPSFEVNAALLSRSQVYVLKELSKEALVDILKQAIAKDEWLQHKNIELKETDALLHFSGGDARKLLSLLDLLANSLKGEQLVVDNEAVQTHLQQKLTVYDKDGEMHYDIISAFIKSVRGSDPNAAVYWLARMIEGGEDIKFIARRLVILASEDIGNANPNALVLATSCFQAVNMIGYPEARIILSQTVTYLASSPKSNAAYMAINQAQALIKKTGDLPVPLPIRNAPTKLMKELNYGKQYQYAHDFPGNFVNMEFLPEDISGTTLYDPGKNERENAMRNFLKKRWQKKYGY